MTKEEIVRNYLSYLENGEMDKVIAMFDKDGVVESPVYGVLPPADFYAALAEDTNNSKLYFDGLFTEEGSNRISLLFDYVWVLKNRKKIQFKVIDIVELTPDNKIKKLLIIYDTVDSREALSELGLSKEKFTLKNIV